MLPFSIKKKVKQGAYFLDNEINIKTKHPEFLEWKWVELDKITDLVVDFKLHVYKEVKDKVKKILN